MGKLKAPPSLKFLALLLLLAALAPGPADQRAAPPPRGPGKNWPDKAVWRSDGGQNLSLDGSRKPGELSRMALGYKVNLGLASQRELTALPGLGARRAAKIIRLRQQNRDCWEAGRLGLNGPQWRELEPFAQLPD